MRILRNHRPSYQQGFARNAAESANPGLWKGLVGAWVPMLGITGATIHDIVAKNNASFQGTYDSNVWSSNESINLDGTSGEYFNSNNQRLLFRQDRWTIVAKIMSADTGSANHHIVSEAFANGASVDGSFLRRHGSGLYAHHDTSGASSFCYKVSGVFTANEIIDLAVTVDGTYTTGKIYADGVELSGVTTGSTFNTPTQTSDGVVIGRATHTGTYTYEGEWDGDIYRILIYDRALSSFEINHLYLDPLAPFRLNTPIVLRIDDAVPSFSGISKIIGGGVIT